MATDKVYWGAGTLAFSIFTNWHGCCRLDGCAFSRIGNRSTGRPHDRKSGLEPLLPQEVEAIAASRAVLLEEDPVCWAVSRMRIQNALLDGHSPTLLGGNWFSLNQLIARTLDGPLAMGLWDSLICWWSRVAARWPGLRTFSSKNSATASGDAPRNAARRDIVGGNWRAATVKPLRGAWLVGFLILFELISGQSKAVCLLSRETVAPIVQVLDIMALCWMGMWFSLRARKPSHIMG
jgi:hypothetical protein